MQSSTHDYFYQNALMGLMSGHLMPWDKDILSDSPLPSTVIEPYMAKEVTDVRDSMRMTYETMVVWIDEAKKVNYFSKRFVQLSKMIMNGVTSMGRGLITLHARGEALDGVPMSIQDLIGVASYHFRKSHMGVLQTVRSHPEISERLLMNQIGWNNMLMRLFKTREKLKERISEDQGARIERAEADKDQNARIEKSKAGESQGARIERAKDQTSNLLPSGEKNLMLTDKRSEEFDAFKLFGPVDRGISEPAAIREPGAFTAPRAFSSYDKNKETNQNKKSEIRNKKSTGTGENDEGRMKKEEINGDREAEMTKTKNEPQNEEESKGNQQNEVITQVPENENNQKEKHPGRNNETKSNLSPEEDGDCPAKGLFPPDVLSSPEEDGDYPAKGLFLPDVPPSPEEDGDCPLKGLYLPDVPPSPEEDGDCHEKGLFPPDVLSSPEEDGDCHEKGLYLPDVPPSPEEDGDCHEKGLYPPGVPSSPEEEDSAEKEPPASNLPLYLQILRNVFTRSGPSENGEFSFTFEELCYLVSDPDFCLIYPDQAAQMRSILQNIDSG